MLLSFESTGKGKTTKPSLQYSHADRGFCAWHESINYQAIIDQLSPDVIGSEFENLCGGIVIDILENYEGFKHSENANKAPHLHNPPFDFFAFKGSKPFVIEFKGSLDNYHPPGETQKRRLRELLKRMGRLNIALLQGKINTAEYRIFYNDAVNLFFDGKKVSINPVAEWVRKRLDKARAANNR
jgi:hypothetical protein